MRFSVVVCTYNYAHLLPDTLRTLAAQTLPDFELLIVDDGSTDNTEEVVAHFRSGFRDCRYLKKSHTGLADSRNVAVQAVQGSHVAFVDADDLWSPHYLRTIRDIFAINPQAELVLCEGIMFWANNGMVTDACLHPGLPRLCGPARSPRDIFSILEGFAPSGMVFSKALYDKTGPFDIRFFGSFGNDIDWTLRALMARAFCLCLKQKLYLYRRHEHNMTNKATDSFEAWLTIYSQTLGGRRAERQVEALARSIIRSHSVRFLPTCSKHEGKALLQRAIEVLEGDLCVRLYYLGTHLGLVGLLKFFKRLKGFGRRLFRKRLAINLNTSYETIFGALPR